MTGAAKAAQNVGIPPRAGIGAARLSFFDGVRGVAAFGVVISHLFQHFLPPMHAPGPDDPVSRLLGSTPLSAFYNGQFSVWVFFVLSGIVLSASLDRDKRLGFPGMVVRRYVRLTLPILAITFLILLIAHGHLIATDRVTASAPVAATLYPPNFAPSLGYWLSNSLFGVYLTGQSDFENVLWTMKVEIWGSLYVFVLWYVVTSRRLRMILCAISFVALSEIPDSSSFQGLQLFPIGILIYDIAKGGLDGHKSVVFPSWLGIVVLFVGIEFGAWRLKQPVIPGADVIVHGLHAVLHFISINRAEAQQIGAVLVVAAVAMTPVLQRVLSTSLFRFLGAVSFPLYLCHLPILASAGCVIFAASYAAWGAFAAPLVMIPATVVITLAVASILTVIVERPSIRLSHMAGRLIPDLPALWPARRAVKS